MKKKGNKTAHGCLQVLAAPVAIGFVLTAMLATLVASLSFTFTNRENMKSVIRLDGVVREFMTRAIEEDIRQKYIDLNLPPAQIDPTNLRQAVDLMVPPDWIDAATSDGIDNVYNFLEEGRTDDYVLAYTPLIETLRSESGRQAMTIIVAHYPLCPSGRMPVFQYEQRNVTIPCLPPDRPVAEVANHIHSMLVDGLNNDPQILASGGVERLTWPPQDPDVVFYIRRAFQVVDLLWLSWLIPLGLLALIAILAVRSLYSLGIWFGCPLLITGLLAPVAGLSVAIWITDLLESFLEEIGPVEDEMGQLLFLFFVNIIDSLRNIWLTGVFLQVGGMLVLGFGGVLLVILLKILARGR